MANQLLEVKDLDVYYGDIQILRSVSLHVEEGTIVALVGANGAGKSTLLKTISGLLKAKKGEILLAGEPLHHLGPKSIVDKGVIQVPEGRRLFSDLTIYENLRLGAFIPRARAMFNQSLEQVYALFPILKDRKNQKAGMLSGGEQQMLAIARAVMAQPKLLMLDEPSLGLSPILVRTIFQLINTLNEHKTTILLVEQNIRQALKIAHHAFVLSIGKIVMEGTGSELLANDEIWKAYIGDRKVTK